MYGICVKCFGKKILVKKLIYPFEHFRDRCCAIYICEECKQEIEEILGTRRLSKGEYKQVFKAWLSDKNVIVGG